MNEALLNRIGSFLDKNPTLKGTPATAAQLAKAEQELDIKLDKDYRAFVERFGGAYAGIAIHAFNNGASVGNETIIDLTLNGRRLFNDAEMFPEINESMVFADDGAGNPVAITPEGKVVLFDYDTEEKQVLASSFEEFVENNFSEW
ncbi:SMI1/KNR4 family protein [Chitinophaga parva]|nr:SMI1/KNR4 family protein [Chitinophaga parva]